MVLSVKFVSVCRNNPGFGYCNFNLTVSIEQVAMQISQIINGRLMGFLTFHIVCSSNLLLLV